MVINDKNFKTIYICQRHKKMHVVCEEMEFFLDLL